MAIETSFTIKQVSVEEALKQAESRVEASARKMDKSLTGVGQGGKGVEKTLQQASKGMDAVSKAGGKVGGVMKNLTGAIAGMMNPIGLVSAGITAIITLVVKLYQSAKEKMAQLAATADWEAKDALKRYERLKDDRGEGSSYLDRLSDINRMEHIDNATKMEASSIIDLLSRKYGVLGLSIDETTGKIVGLTEAVRAYAKASLDSEKVSTEWAIKKAEESLERSRTSDFGMFANEGGFQRIVRAYNPVGWGIELSAAIADTPNVQSLNDIYFPGQEPTPKITEQLFKEHAEKAVNRYVGMVGLDQARKNPEWEKLEPYFKPSDPSERMSELIDESIRVQDEMRSPNTSKDRMASLEKQYDLLKKMMRAQNQIETAYEMQGDSNFSKEEQEKWRKVYEQASDYYVLLTKVLNLEQYGTEKGMLESHKEQRESLERAAQRISDAERQRLAAVQRRDSAQEQYDSMGKSREWQISHLKLKKEGVVGWTYAKQYYVKMLDEEYDELLKKEKEFEQYKDDKGVIQDDAKMREYLSLQEDMRKVELQRVQAETEIANLQTEQIGLQGRLKQYQTDLLKEQKEKTMKWLFSNVLGDERERTNALTQRGGYLANVNITNGLQVNRAILNTVLTANSYLAGIKQAIANAGRI